DPGLAKPRDQPAVAQVVQPRRGIDPGDPEGPEVALLLAAVAVGVPHPALDVFLGGLVQLAAGLEAALGGLHDLLLARVVRDTVLDARHGTVLLGLEQAVHAPEVGRAHQPRLAQLVLPLARLLGKDVPLVGLPPLELARARAGEAL